MHAHFSGNVGQHLVAVFEFDTKHCVWERFYNHAFQQNRVFLRLRQGILLGSVLAAFIQKQTNAGGPQAEEQL